jgi:peptidoglycan hydrolase CwlO-like protein
MARPHTTQVEERMRRVFIIVLLLAFLVGSGTNGVSILMAVAQETCCEDNAACEQLLNEALEQAKDMDDTIAGCAKQLEDCQKPADEQLNPVNQLLSMMGWYAKLPKTARMGISGLLLLGIGVGTAYIETQ